jgi:hypothetical protein
VRRWSGVKGAKGTFWLWFEVVLQGVGAAPPGLGGGEQDAADLIEVGESEEQVKAGGVLFQPAVAHAGVSPESLDDAEGELDLRAQAGLLSVAMALTGGERLGARALVVDQIHKPGLPAVGLEHLVGVGGVARDHGFLAMGQLGEHLAVVHAGRGRLHRVHQAMSGIHADVRLHPEVPVPVFLRRAHLGVAFAGRVLGAARRRENRRVHDGAALQQKAFRREAFVDLGKDALRQPVALQQAAEVEHRRLVGHALLERVQAKKTLKGKPVVHRVLQPGVAEVIPQLQAVQAQQQLDLRLRPARAGDLIMRRHHLRQVRPRHHPAHLVQKTIRPRALGQAA